MRLFETRSPPLPSGIDYGQAWEDADVLIAALDVQSSDRILSICSGGDNVLALLGAGADRVVAIDRNPSQIACLALRVAAFRELEYPEMLEMIGSNRSWRRRALYIRCRPRLEPEWLEYWDTRPELLDVGLGDGGDFEGRFRAFRRRALWLVHWRSTRESLFRGGTRAEREAFYERRWNTWRWRLFCKVFFSEYVMRRLGLELASVEAVAGELARRLVDRTRHALTVLNPAENPYLHWMLTGTHGVALPWALRPENFLTIRSRLDRLECHVTTLEAYLDREGRTAGPRIDKFNLSDIFERMTEQSAAELLEFVANASRPGGRITYWNFLKQRQRPPSLDYLLRPMEHLAQALYEQDKTFFYRALVIDEVM